jgi:hypothetical protein
VKSGRPVSQQDLAFGGPFDVAEHGDELRAPGGTVVDDVTAIGTEGGDGGADETLLYRKKRKKNIQINKRYEPQMSNLS